MDSSKTKNQMIVVTTVGILAALMIVVFSTFQYGMASPFDEDNTTSSMALPVADTPFYREHVTVTGQIQSMLLMSKYLCQEMELWHSQIAQNSS